jgi:hypothetical protein
MNEPSLPDSVSAPVWAMLLVAVLVATKHYIADFLLQTNWMARGKECRSGWLLPLTSHVLCHAGLTLVIALGIAPRLWWLALVDFGVHFGIDRGKALLGQLGRWTPADEKFWWLLGFDQYLHQLTNVTLGAAFFLA